MLGFFLMLPLVLMAFIFYGIYNAVRSILYRFKISSLLEGIERKEDLLFLHHRDFINVIREAMKRNGFHIVMTDQCGEDENGFIVNNVQFAEVWKHGLLHIVDVESARKLAQRMKSNSIHRGMIITLGDFKTNTRHYCHINVIKCINGDQLLDLCKSAQRKRLLLGNKALGE